MKKFEENDILINKVRAYPKVSFFVYNGKVFYNKTNENGVILNNFLSVDLDKIQQTEPVEVQEGILTEASEFIVTENNQNIIQD